MKPKKILFFAKRYKSSSYVLSVVAGYLESKYGSSVEDIRCRMYHPELEEMPAEEVVAFGVDLCRSYKEVSVKSTMQC